MSSARRPEHGGSTPPGGSPVPRIEPGFDSTPAELSPEPALRAAPSHLVPCGRCAALNGRSAMVCWACEADLLALGPFAHVAPPRRAEPGPVPVPVPVVPPLIVVERDGAGGGRRGLHLVSRMGAPALAAAQAPDPPAPRSTALAPSIELPILTAQVEDPRPSPVAAKARLRYPPPLIALVLATVLLLVVAAGLRWLGLPVAVPSPPLAANAVVVGAALDRPFAAPLQSDEPDAPRLSFPSLDVLPGDASADRPARAPTRARGTARAGGKPSETRSAAAPTAGVAVPVAAPPPRQRKAAPARCTSNMAALGFCTLEPASARE